MPEPNEKDNRFDEQVTVEKTGTRTFLIYDLVRSPSTPSWHYTLSVDCSYCHLPLTVHLMAPHNAPQFVKDEALRLATLKHLRTEHVQSKGIKR